IKGLSRLTNLQNLNISGCSNLSHRGLKPISRLVGLRKLNISRNSRFSHHRGWKYLMKLTNVESLKLESVIISRKTTERLCILLDKLKNISELYLGYCEVNERFCKLVSKMPSLKKLSMHGVHNLKSKSFKYLSNLTYL